MPDYVPICRETAAELSDTVTNKWLISNRMLDIIIIINIPLNRSSAVLQLYLPEAIMIAIGGINTIELPWNIGNLNE